jgi:hypothetical protein
MKTIDKLSIVAAIIATVLLGFKYLNPESVHLYNILGWGEILGKSYFQICAGIITGSISWLVISTFSNSGKNNEHK